MFVGDFCQNDWGGDTCSVARNDLCAWTLSWSFDVVGMWPADSRRSRPTTEWVQPSCSLALKVKEAIERPSYPPPETDQHRT